MKQDTDTNRTQPWTRGTGTCVKRMRIHTSPPKACRGRETRVTIRPGRPRPSGHTGEPGLFTNVNSVNPHTEPFVRWAN